MADAEYRIEPTAPWVDKVPTSWKFYKGKYIFGERFEKGNDKNLELLSPTQKYGVIPQTLYDELSGMRAVKVKEDTDLSGFKTVHKGDFCISLRSFQGGFEYSEYEGVVSPAYHILYSKMPISDGYYKYLFKEQSFISEMNSYCQSLRDGKNISYDDFGKTVIPYPSLFEQQAIADYLDDRCSKIDVIIAEATASIEEYKELKQAVIFEAVTKGLDKNAPMKDSNYVWEGFVPAHWKKCRLKDLYDFEKGKNAQLYTKDYIGLNPGEFPVYSGQTENDGVMGLLNTYDYDIDECLFTTTVGAKVMTPKILHGKFSLSQNCLIMKNKGACSNHYIFYLLQPLFNYEKSSIPSYMQPSLRIEDLRRYIFYIPMIEEQHMIAELLDHRCALIDNIIISKKELIKDLVDFKKSLIYEVVTGKRRVV